MVTKPLRVLIIENSEDDLPQLLHELRRGGFEPVFERVETAAAMKGALEKKNWDLIISDYQLPDFNCMDALAVLRESGLDIPFFLISGMIGEETAGEAMKSGARDFIMKGSYARLAPAIERELQGARVRVKQRQTVEKLRRAHGESELHIRELSADLEIANKEMETFSHTVFHDLRAPLSNMSCCCKVLMELFGNRFDGECLGFIRKIYDEVHRMDRLITTLLDYSRLCRCNINRALVDLSVLAVEIAEQLKMTQPERRVSFSIAEEITAHGDLRLLRLAMEHLLGNAWKYTGKREEALIEFGTTKVAGKSACFVRDNGAGFDMTQAKRLFTPFQCLHSREEFDGVGIGLATVQRIIHRHGGRVWAHGEEDKGATLYFTLPPPPSS
jgi:K+-sensing histidine kinase KdpD